MRIKFKAITTDGKWVEGDLTGENIIHTKPPHVDNKYAMFEWYGYEVIPETVCQFTGLHDKNGKEIYSGDIASCNGRIYEVLLEQPAGAYRVNNLCSDNTDNHFLIHVHNQIEITGNIFDHLVKQ